MKDKLGMLLFKEKQVKLLTTLIEEKEWHIADLAKATGVTYIHTSNFVNRCERMGIMGSEKHGRIKRVFLTEKGMEVAKAIATIKQRLESTSNPVQKPEPQNGSDR